MRWLALILTVSMLPACGGQAGHAQARQLIATHCAACHQVPGVSGADGRVGPSLAGIANQQIIAGHFANTPDAMTRWVEHPQKMLPGNAMPEMQLTHDQARTIVAYLYTLEQR